MKFDFAPNPDPLPFGEGDDGFSLRLRPATGEDRMAVFDASVSGSYSDLQGVIDRLVIGWEGVVDPAGNLVPLQYKDGDITKKRFNAFMGAISCEMQFTVISGILAFLGIPTDHIDSIIKALGNLEAKPDMAPTAPPADATPTSVSGG